jgi:hypothetical protein
MKTVVAFVCVCACAVAAAAPIDEAKVAFAAGKAAYERGDYPTALAEFERANQLAPAPTLEYNIGATYERLGRYREAAAAFDRYLATVEPPQTDDERRLVEDVRARAAADHQRADAAPPPAAAPQTNGYNPFGSSAAPPPGVSTAAAAPSIEAAAAPWTKRGYPASLVERPLILPQWMFQPWVGVAITNVETSFLNMQQSGTGEVFAFALDVGLARRLQAGIFFAFPVDPNADFGTFLANLQLGLTDELNLRFDIGGEQISFHSGAPVGSNTQSAFLVGLGLPWKVKLHRMLALFGGSASAPGFGFYPITVVGQTSVYTTTALSSEDLLALAVVDFGGTVGTAIFGGLTLPLGLRVQPHDRISFAVRTAYRMTFTHNESSSNTAGRISPPTPLLHYVPLSFDVVGNIIRQLDVGFTATLTGYIDSTNVPSTNQGYADERVFTIWVNGRL